MNLSDLEHIEGFDWDDGNANKNWIKHNVLPQECEQIFLNEPLLLFEDEKHSTEETRYYALGHTDALRELFVCFTLRGTIRVISARDMSKKERKIYHESKKENPEV